MVSVRGKFKSVYFLFVCVLGGVCCAGFCGFFWEVPRPKGMEPAPAAWLRCHGNGPVVPVQARPGSTVTVPLPLSVSHPSALKPPLWSRGTERGARQGRRDPPFPAPAPLGLAWARLCQEEGRTSPRHLPPQPPHLARTHPKTSREAAGSRSQPLAPPSPAAPPPLRHRVGAVTPAG